MQQNRYSLRKVREGRFAGSWVLRKNTSIIGRFASGYVGILALRYEMRCDERDAKLQEVA